MIDITPDDATKKGIAHIGSQPIALAAIALAVVLAAAGSVALWRASTGSYPETDRAIAARQIQARATEATEQLADKTKAISNTQQEQVDQLQALQEQMQGVKRLLAAQQNDAKRLSDQVGTLTGAIDNLRQSFASAQSSEASAPAPARHARNLAPTRTRSAGVAPHGPRKRSKSHG
jgi:septal ring factor EnvC (AmiA/AmiB activator)